MQTSLAWGFPGPWHGAGLLAPRRAWSPRPRRQSPARCTAGDVCLLVDLGRFEIHSDRGQVQGLTPEEAALYECIRLDLSEVSAGVALGEYEWEEVEELGEAGSAADVAGKATDVAGKTADTTTPPASRTSSGTPMPLEKKKPGRPNVPVIPLLERCGLTIAAQLARFPDPDRPALRLQPEVPRLRFHLSPGRLGCLMRVLRAAAPASGEEEAAGQAVAAGRGPPDWQADVLRSGRLDQRRWTGIGRTTEAWAPVYVVVTGKGRVYLFEGGQAPEPGSNGSPMASQTLWADQRVLVLEPELAHGMEGVVAIAPVAADPAGLIDSSTGLLLRAASDAEVGQKGWEARHGWRWRTPLCPAGIIRGTVTQVPWFCGAGSISSSSGGSCSSGTTRGTSSGGSVPSLWTGAGVVRLARLVVLFQAANFSLSSPSSTQAEDWFRSLCEAQQGLRDLASGGDVDLPSADWDAASMATSAADDAASTASGMPREGAPGGAGTPSPPVAAKTLLVVCVCTGGREGRVAMCLGEAPRWAQTCGSHAGLHACTARTCACMLSVAFRPPGSTGGCVAGRAGGVCVGADTRGVVAARIGGPTQQGVPGHAAALGRPGVCAGRRAPDGGGGRHHRVACHRRGAAVLLRRAGAVRSHRARGAGDRGPAGRATVSAAALPGLLWARAW